MNKWYKFPNYIAMKEVYDDIRFDERELKCPNCGWEGKGSEAIIIDLYGLAKVKEVHCPSCDTYIAGLRSKKDSGPPGSEL